ncbi:MAG: anthranilate synthase component I family protein [Myxococcales bacterium]|jgi:anthranilate/para-aminobenzoate synthase component I
MFARELPGGASADALAARLSRYPGAFWLDGESSHPAGRWSFLGAAPTERVVARQGDPDPLAALDGLHTAGDGPAELPGAPDPADVPRWVGYVAYDAHFAAASAVSGRPVLCFARHPAVIALDHRSGRALLLGDDVLSCDRLQALVDTPAPEPAPARIGSLQVTDADRHRAAIGAALEHIAAGDIYQVNLARRWSAPFEGSPFSLWQRLRAASPVPFGFYFDDGERCVMARTMERFLRWDRRGDRVETRPIKGTIARAGDRDAEEASRLRADEKEQAEHAMIVDLMRNDLGRVGRLGSVRVQRVMAVEPFAGLSHLVSTVCCRLRPGVGLRELIGATFPPGSVTGTPKLRAIEVIAALEDVPRDVYTGAVGFCDRAGGASLAVAIRTAITEPGRVRYWAGGGIVEASDPERELEETQLKARVFLDAVRALQPLPSAEGAS